MPAPDYEDDLVFPPKREQNTANVKEEIKDLRKSCKIINDIIENETINCRQARKENKHLRELLKWCIPYINNNIDVQMGVGHWPELENDLLVKINEVLK